MVYSTGYTDLLTKCHGCAVHKNMLEVILWCIGNKVLPQAVGECSCVCGEVRLVISTIFRNMFFAVSQVSFA